MSEDELLLVVGRVMENQELLHKRLDELAEWTHEMRDYVKVTTSTFKELVRVTDKAKGF